MEMLLYNEMQDLSENAESDSDEKYNLWGSHFL